MTAAPAPQARGADGSQTLERGLKALRLLAESPDGLTATQVAQALDVHRSVAYRLLTTLVRQRFAARDEAARYRAGADLVALAEHVKPRLREAAEPILRTLADELDATACLVVPDDGQAVAISVLEPTSHGARVSYRVGSRDPLDRGAGGIAIRAAGPAQEGEPARVTEARESGYASTSGEVVPGTYAVAAPIRAAHPDGAAAVLLITLRPEVAEAAIARTIDAASQVARALSAPR